VTLRELAERLQCRLEGDGGIEITRVAAIDEAGPGDVTFLSNPKYASKLSATRASAVIADEAVTTAPCAVLRTPQVYLAFAEAVSLLMPRTRPAAGRSPLASIDPTAELGAGVAIGPFAVVGARARVGARTILHPHATVGPDATVGDDCEIHAHASIRDGVRLGHRVVVQDAAVIGSDGYGFARRGDGSYQKIPQVGGVVIDDDVEIGAGTTIDRPAIGETHVGAGTKIDNLVQVAHGVRIGRNVLLAAQVGIAGSTVIDDAVMMAGQSGAAGHVRLGAGSTVLAKSAVTKDVGAGEQVAGIPAGDAAEWREASVLLRRLPELRKAVAALEGRLAALEARLDPKK
jgi:UDP-3-O-[3-hydroxymyristoyl] glucosamine N-acyltransferase